MSRTTPSEIEAPNERSTESVHSVERTRFSREFRSASSRQLLLLAMFVSALAVGVLSAWHGGVFTIGDDGVSYLDLSDAWRNHDWATAANGCWSPAYPVLLAATLGITHPSALWEPIVVRGLNLMVYVAAMFAFAFFWRELARSIERRAELTSTSSQFQTAWLLLGFALFLFFGVHIVGASLVSPDLALFACVLVVAGILVRIQGGDLRWQLFVWLGVVCALGYLFKAIMFPMTFIFLGVVYLAGQPKRRSVLPRLGVTLATFLLLSAPWILMLSRTKGRLTYSDVGRLNYLWFASEGFNDYGYPFPWNPAPGEGKPIHPMHELLHSPRVFEFHAPFRGSYPLWDDPSYWYEGARVPFHFKQQVRTILNALTGYPHLIELQSALLVGALFLLFAAECRRGILRAWYLALPALVALGLYAVSHGLVQNRYTAPFLPLLWGAVFAELYLLHLTEHSRRFLTAISLAMAIMLSFPLGMDLAYNLLQTAHKVHAHTPMEHHDVDVANYLGRVGLYPGDNLGYIQAPEDGTNKYWARLAKMTIVADMSYQDVPAFWESDAATETRVLAAFREAGVRAIVAYNVPPKARSMGWQKVGSSDYYVLAGPALLAPPTD